MGDFGGMFDFNRDGETDTVEFLLGMELTSDIDTDDIDDDDDDELELAGLDRDELEFMDDDERREALEDAGLDPDDYDF